MAEQSAYPLAWPAGWKRAPLRRVARFAPRTLSDAVRFVLAELRRMGVSDWDVVISTNVQLRLDGLPKSGQAAPADPGVAVYFAHEKRPLVLACDTWTRVEHNLHAIGKHVEAMRGMDRWGVGSVEQAFTGYLALPAPAGDEAWWRVLEFDDEHQALEVVRDVYRHLAKQHHPDQGGDARKFQRIVRAWEQAQEVLGS